MAKTLIKTAGAISAGTGSVSFVDGTSDVVFDNTYSVYEWHFYNMHPGTDNVTFGFQVNSTNDPASGGGAYDTSPITSTYFRAKHDEAGSGSHQSVDYITDFDLGNVANTYQVLPNEVGADDDPGQSTSGVLTLYDPSSTTYVKHFTARFNDAHPSDITMDCFIAGYINDYQYAIDEIDFKFSSGTIGGGTIKMFGVS